MRVVATCLLSVSIAWTSSAQATKKRPAPAPTRSAPTATRPAPTPLSTAIALYDAEKLDQAKTMLTPLAAAGDPDAMLYLGRIAIDQSKGDTAVDWIEQAVKKNDRSSLYYQWLGTAYGIKIASANMFAQMSLAPTIKRTMERAVELDSSNVEARINLTGFYLQAPPVAGGGVDKARDQVAAIMRLNPYQGHLQEGTIAQNQHDTVTAEQIYRDLVTAFPDSSQPTVSLAIFYTSVKRYEDSFRVLEDRLKRFPDDGPTLYQLGRLGAVSGLHLDRAQVGLNRYIKMPHRRGTQTIAAAHWRLGMVLEAKGDRKTAKSEYETALSLDPNLAGAKAALDKLNK